MHIETILVPVDFSTCSMLVTYEAAGLAKQVGGRLVMMHAAMMPAGLAPGVLVRPDGAKVSAAEYLAQDAADHLTPYVEAARSQGVEVEALIREGEVVDSILAAANDVGADLVVMGTHGRAGLARVLLGSVAEETARRADVPVLLIRRKRRPNCARAHCGWCSEGVRSAGEEQMLAEADG